MPAPGWLLPSATVIDTSDISVNGVKSARLAKRGDIMLPVAPLSISATASRPFTCTIVLKCSEIAGSGGCIPGARVTVCVVDEFDLWRMQILGYPLIGMIGEATSPSFLSFQLSLYSCCPGLLPVTAFFRRFSHPGTVLAHSDPAD
jgi:hypothetical protein